MKIIGWIISIWVIIAGCITIIDNLKESIPLAIQHSFDPKLLLHIAAELLAPSLLICAFIFLIKKFLLKAGNK